MFWTREEQELLRGTDAADKPEADRQEYLKSKGVDRSKERNSYRVQMPSRITIIHGILPVFDCLPNS